MSLARPKSQILTTLLSESKMFLAARSRWIHWWRGTGNIKTEIKYMCVQAAAYTNILSLTLWPLHWLLLMMYGLTPTLPNLYSYPIEDIRGDVLLRPVVPKWCQERTFTQTHIKHRTLREARNSIPRATWKLKEIRSSRNKGELDLGSRERSEAPQ